VLPGIVGTIQATEAIKLILGIGESLSGRLLVFDALATKFRTLKLRRDPSCPVCGENPTITSFAETATVHSVESRLMRPASQSLRLASGGGDQAASTSSE